MDSSEQHDERELEVIRDEMERKREALADKIGALETQVVGTMQSATDAVSDVKQVVATVQDTISDTVSSVKDTVSSTVQSVADTFNFSRHVENYPWAAVGCAVAAGFAGGYLLGGPSREDKAREDAESGDFRGLHSRGEAARAPEPEPEPPARSDGDGIGSQLLGSLGQTWERLTGGVQGLAVGALMGLVREMAAKSLPQSVVSDVSRFIDDVSDKLGGKATELSRSVVDYVQQAVASPHEDEPPAPAAGQPGQAAKSTAPRPQHRNGSRHRAGSL